MKGKFYMKDIIKNKTKAETSVEIIMTMNYGDTISHNEISKVIDESYGLPKYNSVVQKAKKTLLNDYGRMLESIRGNGYRVVQPDSYTDHSLKHFKRSFNEAKKGATILSHAPTKDMTEEGRETFRRVNDRAMMLKASLAGSFVELKTLGEKRHPFLPKNIRQD